MELHDRIRLRRKELNLSQEDLAQKLGYRDRSSIARIETGKNNLTQSKIEAFADALQVTPAYLMGWEPAEPKDPTLANVLPLPRTYKVPLVGAIACGKPILAVEESDETVDVPEYVHADFALTCKGDSMITARIFDGDIVYIHSQPQVETGQIAAVRIEDEATLKKVYYTPGSDRITLRACNPLYPDMVYEGETLNQIQVLGLAVGFYSTIRHEQ